MKITKHITNEDGFAFTATAVVIAIILALFILYFSNSASLDAVQVGNEFANSQAKWSAIAGIETARAYMMAGQFDFAGTRSLGNSTITLDTLTTDPINNIILVTSTGRYDNSIKILETYFELTGGDTAIDEEFDTDDGFSYSPEGGGPSGFRYWGMSCGAAADSSFLPQYVLTGADSCFFFGTKVQNNSELDLDEVDTDASGNYILTLSLAAGVDVANVANQSKFQTGDFLEIYVNGVLIERWEGTSAAGGQPMTPRVGATTQSLTPVFLDFELDITAAIGAQDEIEIEFEGNTNTDYKYIGIDGLTLHSTGGYKPIRGTLKKK